MSTPYVGEIRMFAGNFAPAGWSFCDGSLLPISENETLFNLIGTTFGGDGQSTFQLPDLRGRVPIHMGQGPGSSTNYLIGQSGGVEEVTLTTTQIPSHNHIWQAGAGDTVTDPTGRVLAGALRMFVLGTPGAGLMGSVAAPVGGSQPHTNLQPVLAISFIISLFGVFPSQT